MNRAEEERLVAMYFDNSDFEKHAKETIKTLDQLKDSMNLEDSVKGFDMFDKMKRNAGLEQMQKSADKLKNTFSGIGTVLNKTFSIASGPLKTLENTFATIRGYVGKYLGFDFASKLVSSVEGMFRSLMIAPISDGWRQYENEIDSVQTIMSSTGRSIQDVTHQLDILTDYADKTVYSLSDMTSNIGKFTNNGVELEDATQAMMGIANAAAAAGQGTQQASMAMYNFSQAIGVGKMTSIDWKSIENANMATKELKNTFIEIAAAKNELKKIGEGEEAKFYYTKDSNGRELKDKSKWTEVTYKNFRETLSKGWLTSDAMTAALRIYSGENLTMNQLVAMGIEDKDLQKKLLETGKNALEAAKQVRTFSKMMSSLKDAAASGWSRTFTLIFGNANEATTLWTSLSEKIGGAMDKSAAYRNKVLKDWKDTREVVGTKMVDTGSTAGMVTQTLYGRNGREILIDSLNNILHIIGQIKEAFSKAFGDVFGTITGKDLFEKTQAFEKTTINIRKYFGELNDQGSRMNKIYRVIRGIISAFSLWKKSIRNLIDTVVRIFVPSFGGVLDLLANVGDFIYELNKADPSEALGKIADKLKGIWDKVKKFFSDLGQSVSGFASGAFSSVRNLPLVTWLSDLADTISSTAGRLVGSIDFSGAWGWLNQLWESAKGTWATLSSGAEKAFGDLKDFLAKPYEWLLIHLGLKSGGSGESESGEDFDPLGDISFEDAGIVKWLNGVFDTVAGLFGENAIPQALVDVKNEIVNFFTSPWAWIQKNILGEGSVFADVVSPGGQQVGFVNWLSNVWQSISDFWNNTVIVGGSKLLQDIGSFLGDTWAWINSTFHTSWDFMFEPGEHGQTGFVNWISGIWASIKNFWEVTILPHAQEILQPIGQFIGNTWEWIKSKFNASWDFMFEPGEHGQTGFVNWISGIWASIKNFWEVTILPHAHEVLQPIGQFLGNTWEWIKSKFNAAWDFMNEPEGDGETGFSKWLRSVYESIESAWNWVVKDESGIFTAIGKFLSDTWTWIVEIFNSITGSGSSSEKATETVQDAGEETAAPVEAAAEVGEEISETTEESVSIFNDVIKILGGFLDKIKEFVGRIVDFDSATKLFTGLGTFISGAFSALGDILSVIGKWLKGNKSEITESEWESVRSVLELLSFSFIPALVSLVTTLVGGLISKKFGVSFVSIGSEIRDLGIGIGVVVASIIGLKTFGVDEKDLEKYGPWLLGIGVVLAGIIAVVGWVKGQFAEAQGEDEDHPWADFGNAALKAIEKIAIIWVVMDKLPAVLNAAAEAKAKCPNVSYAEDLMQTVMAIMGAVVAIVAVVELFGLINEKASVGIGATQSAMLVVVEAVAIVLGSLWVIDQMFEDVQQAQNMAAKAKSIGDAIGNIFGGIVEGLMTAIGKGLYVIENGQTPEEKSKQDMTEFNNMVDQFIKVGEVLDIDRMAALSDMLDRFTKMGQQFTFDNTEFSNLFSLESFKGFASGFGIFITTFVELLRPFDETAYGGGEEPFKKRLGVLDALKDEDFVSKIQAVFDFIPSVMRPLMALDFNKDLVSGFTEWAEELKRQFEQGGFNTFLDDVTDIFGLLQVYASDGIVVTESGYSLSNAYKNFDKLNGILDMFNSLMEFYSKMMETSFQGDTYSRRFNSGKSSDKRGLFAINISRMLTDADEALDELQKHPKLEDAKNLPAVSGLMTILDAFNLMADGIGSAEWEKQFRTFQKYVTDDSAVDNYIKAVESIYDRLKESKLGKDEGITFDGIQIVQRLFEAVQEGFDSITEIPTINAQPLIEGIVLAISGGKDQLVQAIREMVQAGIDESVNKEVEGLDSNGIDVLQNAGKVIDLFNQIQLGGEGGFANFNIGDLTKGMGLDALVQMLDSPEIQGKMDEIQNKLPKLTDLVKLDLKDPVTGKDTDLVTYMQNQVQSIQAAIDQAGSVQITITPTFNLDEITPVKLQEQLNKYTYRIPATVNMPETNFTYEGLKTALDIETLKQKLDNIASRIDVWGNANNNSTIELGTHMDGIGNKVSGMRLWIDGKALVGYIVPSIDRELGDRAARWSRTGTVIDMYN